MFLDNMELRIQTKIKVKEKLFCNCCLRLVKKWLTALNTRQQSINVNKPNIISYNCCSLYPSKAKLQLDIIFGRTDFYISKYYFKNLISFEIDLSFGEKTSSSPSIWTGGSPSSNVGHIPIILGREIGYNLPAGPHSTLRRPQFWPHLLSQPPWIMNHASGVE